MDKMRIFEVNQYNHCSPFWRPVFSWLVQTRHLMQSNQVGEIS